MKYSKTISYERNGKTISYTREYNRKYGRNIKIVKNRRTGKSYAYREYKITDKNGNTKTVRRRIKNIMKDGKMTQYGEEYIQEYMRGLSTSDKNDLRAWLSQERRDKNTVTVEKLTSHLSDTQVERFIYNMGGEPEDLAADLDIDESELFNKENWNFDDTTFTYDGVTYEFTFDYATHNITWKVKDNA